MMHRQQALNGLGLLFSTGGRETMTPIITYLCSDASETGELDRMAAPAEGSVPLRLDVAVSD